MRITIDGLFQWRMLREDWWKQSLPGAMWGSKIRSAKGFVCVGVCGGCVGECVNKQKDHE